MVTEPEFRDVQFMTAAQKHSVLRVWKTFLRHGCQEKHFTRAIYQHLTLHCSFIAHFSKGGFYGVYFTTGDAALKFFGQFDPDGRGISVEYGDCHWLSGDYEDINGAMREAVRPYLVWLRQRFSRAQEERDLALATALAAKHGRRLA